MPELSIVVPTYRRPVALARALASAKAATSRACELIVVDDDVDGSGFGAAREAGARYLAKAGIERGLSQSRNLGITLARGSFITFLDDDDAFAPGALEPLLDAARNSGALVFGDHGLHAGERRQAVDVSTLTLDALLVCNRLPVGSWLLPRAAALRHGFDERMRSHEDWHFLLTHAATLGLHHVPGLVAWIDKSDNHGGSHGGSMQARRRRLFGLDFLSVYARHPAPHLAEPRSRMLATLGLQVPAGLLDFADLV